MIRAPTIDIVGILGIESFFQFLGSVEVKLFFGLILVRIEEMIIMIKLTAGIEFHSLLRILLISPVRIDWFSEET